ncbi:hypothetical protein GCM10028803_03420 [Larkinella knui]
MQLRSFLRRNGVPSIGGAATHWLVPMLSAATVAGLLILTVWQYRTNQKLEQTVRTLKDTVTILQQAQPETTVAQLPKTDTVYITREIPTPRLLPSGPNYRSQDNRRGPDRLETDDSATDLSRNDSEPTVRQKSDRVRPEATPLPEKTGSNERFTQAKELTEPNPATTGREPSEQPDRNGTPTGNSVKPSGDRWNRPNERYSGNQKPPGFETTRPLSSGAPGSDHQTGTAGSTTGSSETASISWKPLQSRPVEFDSNYYAENYQRRIRRIRPLTTSSPVVTSSAAKPVIEEPQRFVRFRIGGSAEIGGSQSGFGLAGEVLLGNHLTVGLGLSKLRLAGDHFLSDIQYNVQRRSDFRGDFPGKVPPADPRTEILDINQKGKSWQFPITFGYRMPLGNSVTIIPSVGASFSLRAREYVTFTHRKGPNEFNPVTFYAKCPTGWYNSMLVSIAVEKQWSHWAVQASPYLSNPLSTSPFTLNRTSAGLRARVLYQF